METARLWRSLGHHDRTGRFHIDGVTGPDEYSAIADNNVYTNLMAQRNLRAAADAVDPPPATRRRRAGRRRRGDRAPGGTRPSAMHVPYDEELGVHPQSEGFTRPRGVGLRRHAARDSYPLLLHYPYFDLYRKQVVKQADLVLAMHLRGDAFTAEQKARNFAYYEALTVRDSSLSACTQAVIAAEVGHLELAHDYLGEAALMDLDDRGPQHPRRPAHGVAGRRLDRAGRGLRRDAASTGRLCFAPRLPGRISRLAFRVRYRGRAEVSGRRATAPPTGCVRLAAAGRPPRRADRLGEEPVGARSSRCRPAPGPTSRRGGSRNGAVARLRDVEHALERDPGPLGGRRRRR